jgi:hypothetical protein
MIDILLNMWVVDGKFYKKERMSSFFDWIDVLTDINLKESLLDGMPTLNIHFDAWIRYLDLTQNKKRRFE